MFNQEVQITFSLAVREAQRRHHEFLTTEHVLYAMLFDEQGREILKACGGDVETLRTDLELFFEQHLESLEQLEGDMPEQTVGLQNVLQRTVTHMQSSGREEIGIGDILAAIMEQEDCLAAQILQSFELYRSKASTQAPVAQLVGDFEQAACTPLRGRVTRDQLVGQRIIEVGDLHRWVRKVVYAVHCRPKPASMTTTPKHTCRSECRFADSPGRSCE